jgi:poly(A) polymerase
MKESLPDPNRALTENSSQLLQPLMMIREMMAERGSEAYLVGGFVRDILLGRSATDVDIAVPENAVIHAQSVADALGAVCAVLGDKHKTARVVLYLPRFSANHGARLDTTPIHIDFADFRGPRLTDDLSLRDFTVNAAAVPLADVVAFLSGHEVTLIDPTGGLRDLESKLLRVAHSAAFHDDPIRLLRAIRLEGELGFVMDYLTVNLVRVHAPLLACAASERTLDEIMRMLRLPSSPDLVERLHQLGLLTQIIPELANNPNAYRHSLQAVRQLLTVTRRLGAPEAPPEPVANRESTTCGKLSSWWIHELASMKHETAAGRSRFALLVLAALLHSLDETEGTISTRSVVRRLRMSSSAERSLEAILASQPFLETLIDTTPVDLAIHRYLKKAGSNGIPAMLFSMAHAEISSDWSPRRRRHLQQFADTTLVTVKERFHEVVEPTMWINGDTLKHELGAIEGPAIGRILSELREARAAGTIISREDELREARTLLDLVAPDVDH